MAQKTAADVVYIAGQLDDVKKADPDLDVAATIAHLVRTEHAIIQRFAQYELYPFQLWKICVPYNRAAITPCIDDFLDEEEQNLDIGISLVLRKKALATGSRALAHRYLESAPVQLKVEKFLLRCSATSMDVERKNARDKRREAQKVGIS